MSDNIYRIPGYKPGSKIKAKDLNKFKDGVRAATPNRSYRNQTRSTGNGHASTEWPDKRDKSTAKIKLYRVITANYSGDPETENIYTVREASDFSYPEIPPVAEPDDIQARVSADGYPFGLIVGRVYPSFIEVGSIPVLNAPEMFDVKITGGVWKLMDSHQGTELMTIANSDIEVKSLPTITLSKYTDIYFDAKWDLLREKLTVYIPSL